MTEERRMYPRSRLLRRGQIVFNGGHSTMECVLLDLSGGGAQLRVDNWMLLPHRFEVRIKDGPRYFAEVRHRNMEFTGVRFLPG